MTPQPFLTLANNSYRQYLDTISLSSLGLSAQAAADALYQVAASFQVPSSYFQASSKWTYHSPDQIPDIEA